MRSVSRGDTKNVCLLFNSLLPPKSEKGERERRKNVSLFSKKTLSFSLSLSLQLFLFLSSICFGCRFVFFSSLLHFFSLGEIKVLVFSLFFPCFCWGDRKTHPFVSLSLLRRERFGKPDLPIEYSAAHAERGIIFEKEEINSSGRLARESRKKKMDWISSHCGTNSSHTGVASKTKTHISENKSMCMLPCVRPRGACLQNSFFCCFNIYMCIFCVKISL